MKRYLPILIPIAVFLLLKISSLGIRMSDTNIYFYTAYQLLQGKLLYKDIFFTNFPVLPYVSMIYFYIVGKSLTWYYFTAAVEVSVVGFLLFHIVWKKTKDSLIALTTSLLYPFSFIVLTTSDHQTGVFFASLFAVLSYFFTFEKKQYAIGGACIALALLTKAYFLPVFLALFVTLAVKNYKKLFLFFIGATAAAVIVLLPSLLLARNDLIKDVFIYSFTRSQGIEKVHILWFFLKHDFLLAVLFLSNIFLIRKHLFFALLSLFSLLFILFYQDIYYLYLNFAIPFLCLSFANLHSFIREKLRIQKMVAPSIVAIFLAVNLGIYISSYRNLQKVVSIDQITALIRKEKPPVLYGTNDITPALAYLTNTPLLHNVIDTNENIFRKGFLQNQQLTHDAIQQHAIIITQGALYSEFNLKVDIIGGIFDQDAIQKFCTPLQSFAVVTEGNVNRMNLFQCNR